MTKLILFEGPDCAGKTTLIESIVMPGDHYIHNGLYPSQQAAIDAYLHQFEETSKSYDTTFIDRAHWSEQAYGKVIRDTHMLQDDWEMLENKLLEINALTVLCLPSIFLAHERWSERNKKGEEFVTKRAQYTKIYIEYIHLLKKASSNIVLYDYTDPFKPLTEIARYLRS